MRSWRKGPMTSALSARTSAEEKLVIEYGSRLARLSLSNFIRGAALTAAHRIIATENHVSTASGDQEIISHRCDDQKEEGKTMSKLGARAQGVLKFIAPGMSPDIVIPAMTRNEMLKMPNCGPKTIIEIERYMEERGLCFRTGYEALHDVDPQQ